MLGAALIPIVATALGAALGLGARRWLVVFEPVRSFALAAVCVTIAVHLMPEAVEAAGPWALAVLAGGLVLPSALGWIAGRVRARDGGDPDRHAALAEELTYLGVLAHQIGDGLALGTAATADHDGARWALFLAIGAHTVPLAAVVAITFAERRGARAAIARAAVVAVMPLAGLALVRAVAGAEAAAPWLGAAVSGLLLHVLAHDLPSAQRRTGGIRTAELAAIALGIGLPLATAGAHHGLAGEVTGVLRELALAAAPALLVGILAGAALHAVVGRARVAWLPAGGGPRAALRGALLGVPLPPCSCDVVPVAGELRARGGGAAAVAAFLLAAPELGLAAVLLTAALLGWELALIRLAAAIAIAVIAGLVVERLARDRGADAPGPLPRPPRSLAAAVDDRIAHDGAWIVVGLLVAAFVAAAVPAGALGGPLDLLVVAAIALPLGVSATAATPVAAALVAAGLSPGAALAGVLLGSMVNRATLGLVRAAWGAAAAAAVAVVALAGALGLGAALARLPLTPLAWTGGAAPLAALVLLGALVTASLWRHGLAHFLAALRGPDHGHDHAHAHAHGHAPHEHHDHA